MEKFKGYRLIAVCRLIVFILSLMTIVWRSVKLSAKYMKMDIGNILLLAEIQKTAERLQSLV